MNIYIFQEEVDEEKETPLTRCAAVRAAATAALLLERGADCERCDVRGRSPLTAAAEAGAVGVVKALLAAGYDDRQGEGGGEETTHEPSFSVARLSKLFASGAMQPFTT